MSPFDEDDLCARQEKIERTPYQRYLRRRGAPPALFLYDITSTYLEGEQMSGQEVHDSYVGLQNVERDFRAMKTGFVGSATCVQRFNARST